MMNVHFYEELPSTNLFLNELLQQSDCEEFYCVSTDFQSKGRGQTGNGWESERGKNLTFSLLLKPVFLSPVSQFVISQLISVSLKKVLDGYTDGVTIKWPNDIYWQDRKIAGILIENSLMGHSIETSIVGIGLNVNQTEFVSGAPNPVSLKMILETEVDRRELLNDILTEICDNYQIVREKGASYLQKFYFANLYRKEGYHPFSDQNSRFFARIIDIHDDGRLILETEQGEEKAFYFKEVSFE